MINTQIKLQGNIHYGSKVVAFRKNHTKFQDQFDLEVKVKDTSF